MRLIINGQEREILSSTNLEELIRELEINAPHYAVALNQQVVPKSQHGSTAISEGDRVEIVHAVGGGT